MDALKIAELIDVCKHFRLQNADQAVIKEPYIPYLPAKWNRVLVIAEAQNLSNKNSGYVERLKRSSVEVRIQRLGRFENIGIQPWDDGYLKIALESAFDYSAVETAVSNSIPWSQVDSLGRNISPSKDLIEYSIQFWIDLLPLMNVRHLITSGEKANQIMTRVKKDAGLSIKHTRLKHSSPVRMNRIKKKPDETKILAEYPQILRVIKRHPEWISIHGNRKNKIYFAREVIEICREEC